MNFMSNISQKWTQQHLERLKIDQLVRLAVLRCARTMSFKQAIIDYLLAVGPGKL